MKVYVVIERYINTIASEAHARVRGVYTSYEGARRTLRADESTWKPEVSIEEHVMREFDGETWHNA